MNRFASIIVAVIVIFASHSQAESLAPYGVSQFVEGDKVVVYWYFPAVNETTIAVIDDEPHSYVLYGTADCGARLASVFDLPNSLCAIEAVELRLWPSDPFPRLPGNAQSAFGLCVDSTLCAGVTTERFWQRDALSAEAGTMGWLRFPVRKSIFADSVVVEFRWLDGTPTAPLPAVVYTTHFVNSFIGASKNGVQEWSELVDVAALMRVRINLADIYGGRATGVAVPDSFSVFLFDVPSDESPSEAYVVAIRDSLHIFLERENADGKFVAVAAWQNNVMGPKSELIQIDAATGVEGDVLPITSAGLSQNFPNPFNAETIIQSRHSEEIAVYDLLGREVCRLSAQDRGEGGLYHFEWNGRKSDGNQVPSGVYFYRQEGQKGVKKLVLLK